MNFRRGILSGFACLWLLLSTASAQSLGERARELRHDPAPQVSDRVLTNDDLAPYAADTKTQPSEEAVKAETTPDAAKADGKTAEKKPTEADQAKAQQELAAKLESQKQKVAELEHELEVLQSDNKVRISNSYGDASARLRDPKRFADEQRKYETDIAAKQKDLEDAKSKLDQMTDEARKSDLPDSPQQ